MPRGQAAKDGDTFKNRNGYHYTRVNGMWRATSHIVAEAKLGRPLDLNVESVRFADGDRANFDPANIVVQPKGKMKSKDARIAKLQSQIFDLQAELKLLLDE